MDVDQSHLDFLDAWEQPLWDSLKEVYERSCLRSEETAALERYQNKAKYWLLRAKVQMVVRKHGPSLIRCLAGYLRFLNSDCIIGDDPPRASFVRDIFSDKTVHTAQSRPVRRTSESGELEEGVATRIKMSSPKFFDTLAELRVLAFFCANGYKVGLPSRGASGKKPEFYVQLGALGVEVKNINADAALDHIFGHGFSPGAPLEPKPYRIVRTIDSQYRNASCKFTTGRGLVFMFIPLSRSDLENDLPPWQEQLMAEWRAGTDECLVGVVFVFTDTVDFLRHPSHGKSSQQLEFPHVELDHLAHMDGVYNVCEARNLWPK